MKKSITSFLATIAAVVTLSAGNPVTANGASLEKR